MTITENVNGDITISKKWFVVITIALMLLSAFASVVATGTTMQNDIKHLQNEYSRIDNLDARLNAYEKQTEITIAQLTDMKEDIRVIRRDIQELLKK